MTHDFADARVISELWCWLLSCPFHSSCYAPTMTAAIEQEAQSLLASIDDNEALAYTSRFGLDGVHRTSAIAEEIYLPKTEHAKIWFGEAAITGVAHPRTQKTILHVSQLTFPQSLDYFAELFGRRWGTDERLEPKPLHPRICQRFLTHV